MVKPVKYKPVVQFAPMYSVKHSHVYWLIPLTQFPWMHGEL